MRSKCFRKNSVKKARKNNNLKKTKAATEVAIETVMVKHASTVANEVVMAKTEASEVAMARTQANEHPIGVVWIIKEMKMLKLKTPDTMVIIVATEVL